MVCTISKQKPNKDALKGLIKKSKITEYRKALLIYEQQQLIKFKTLMIIFAMVLKKSPLKLKEAFILSVYRA